MKMDIGGYTSFYDTDKCDVVLFYFWINKGPISIMHPPSFSFFFFYEYLDKIA